MQKGDQNKLKLMLTGVKARAVQNQDYFVSMEFLFRSGGKKFRAALTRAAEDYQLTFQGTVREIGLEEALSFFEQQAALYEESVLTYTERGSTMTVTGSTEVRDSEIFSFSFFCTAPPHPWVKAMVQSFDSLILKA